MRTRFGLSDGSPVQIIEPNRPFVIPLVDLSDIADAAGELERLIEREAGREFDLAAAPPVAFVMVKMDDESFVLVVSSHHIITDAQSWNIFLRDLAIAYESKVKGTGPSWPPLATQYADYTVWQRLTWRRDGPRYRAAILHTKEQLQGQPILPNVRSFRSFWRPQSARAAQPTDWSIFWGLTPETSRRLKAVGHGRKATPYMVRVAATVPVLASISASDRVVVGTVFAARSRRDLRDVFGLFANLVPLVIDIDRNASFNDLVDKVRIAMLGAHDVAELPFEELAAGLKEEGVVMPGPPFWIQMATPSPRIRGGGLELHREDSLPSMPINGMIARFDLQREADRCALSFDPYLFGKSELQELVNRLVRSVEYVARNPDEPLSFQQE